MCLAKQCRTDPSYPRSPGSVRHCRRWARKLTQHAQRLHLQAGNLTSALSSELSAKKCSKTKGLSSKCINTLQTQHAAEGSVVSPRITQTRPISGHLADASVCLPHQPGRHASAKRRWPETNGPKRKGCPGCLLWQAESKFVL